LRKKRQWTQSVDIQCSRQVLRNTSIISFASTMYETQSLRQPHMYSSSTYCSRVAVIFCSGNSWVV
jgi:hypothetical protein